MKTTWIVCIVALGITRAASGLACGYWNAEDLEMGWGVSFSCAGDNARIVAFTPEGGVPLFTAEWEEIAARYAVADGGIRFSGERVGTLDGDRFRLGEVAYEYQPCATDEPCPDTPTVPKLLTGGKEILRGEQCRSCPENIASRLAAYLLFREAFLAAVDGYRADHVADLRKLERGLRRRKAAAALVLSGMGADAVPVLRKVLKDKAAHRRTVALAFFVVTRLGPQARQLIPEVQARLDSGGGAYIRSAAAQTLSKIGATASVPSLLKLTGHRDYRIRGSAIRAIGRLGRATDEVVATLLSLLESPRTGTRLTAVEALGTLSLDTPEVIRALEGLSEKDIPRVAEAARLALAGIAREGSPEPKSEADPRPR